MRNACEEPASRFVPLRVQQLEQSMGAGPSVRTAGHLSRAVRLDAFYSEYLVETNFRSINSFCSGFIPELRSDSMPANSHVIRFSRRIFLHMMTLMRTAVVLVLLALSSNAVRADPANDLVAARDLWHAASISTYSFVYTNRDATLVAPRCNWDVLRTHVKKGRPTLSVVLRGIGSCPRGTVLSKSELKYVPRTVEDLFAVVERVLKLGPEVADVEVEYDPSHGFPVHLRAGKIGMSDSDEEFEITEFSPRR